jgi:hypothetical protein
MGDGCFAYFSLQDSRRHSQRSSIMQQSETSRPEVKVWQPFHAGAAFARFCREMIPDPHCRSSSGAVAVLLALQSSTAAAGSVDHANQNAEE